MMGYFTAFTTTINLIHVHLNSVSSGGQGMAFFWRGNQLFAKYGPTGDNDGVWTTFLMDMREPLEVNIYLFDIVKKNSFNI
jgi:hypothetical protein